VIKYFNGKSSDNNSSPGDSLGLLPKPGADSASWLAMEARKRPDIMLLEIKPSNEVKLQVKFDSTKPTENFTCFVTTQLAILSSF
jgi:hypothetical protein